MHVPIAFLVLLAGSYVVLSSPLRPMRASSVISVPVSELNSFAPYTQFARAAYCGSAKVKNWSCGQACVANSDFQPTLVGGNGASVPYWYVGYWPSQNSVVVAHEGTDPTQFKSLLIDANIKMTALNASLFPGIPSVGVHKGFAYAHAASASQIIGEVKRLVDSTGAKTVVTVGHSLGGALAELDSLFFVLNLGSGINVQGVTYGTPRVGDPRYAAFFDNKINGNFKRINNINDIIPILPGRFLGFSHVQGEVHIIGFNKAVACSGDDDAIDPQCTISSVPNIFEGDLLNHLGPYQGISIGTIFCT